MNVTTHHPDAILVVTARRAGFRRGGRAWPATETRVRCGEFADAQLAQILAEDMLVTRVEPAPVPEPPKPAEPGDDAVIAAFDKLAAGDFKEDGAPKAAAVSKLLGQTVRAERIAELWARKNNGD